MTDTNIEFVYKVSENLPVSESYKVVLEMLDGVLANSKLKIHILEPMAKEVQIKHVVPKKFKGKIENEGTFSSRDIQLKKGSMKLLRDQQLERHQALKDKQLDLEKKATIREDIIQPYKKNI